MPPKKFPQLATPALDATAPTVESVLLALTEARILDLSRLFGCEIREASVGKERLARRLALHVGVSAAGASSLVRLPAVLRELGRDELRAVCRRHDLATDSPARSDLAASILVAAGLDPKAASIRPPPPRPDDLPQKGQVVEARHRQWLVDETVLDADGGSPLVRLVCLDDDDPGRRLDVLWELELGAKLVSAERHGLGDASRLDPPHHFGAYLHALKWSAVSAADATKFQAPFRAGIKLMAHQLTPLMKALELPRANLFIADDVGLGKTIEAGLVLQELLLRQQASFVLVVCPASVCLQWQGEMMRRFGLRFEVMTRQFVSYKRRDRGFATNPWSTHNRFIISHALLRRPEYRDQLLVHLGDRAKKGLLILDEAHVAAPASASKYATDTDITRTIRDLAPRFDNRLFLSATPHNGHTNSFSALLEILDPARFSRGIPVDGKRHLEPIMVRRLKRDLRQLGVESFPKRTLVELALRYTDGGWNVHERVYDAETGEEHSRSQVPLRSERERAERERSEFETAKPFSSEQTNTELLLADQLRRYTELCAPNTGLGRLPFIHLQQRLLSSPEAFARSLDAHAQNLAKKGGLRVVIQQRLPSAPSADLDSELHGEDEESALAEEEARIATHAAQLPSPSEEAQSLLSSMRALAEKARRQPDAKALALLAWLRENLCTEESVSQMAHKRKWNMRRVILFTEYADTKRYWVDLLTRAFADTDDADRRIMQFHGGMGDDARDEVQRAFNTDPAEHPVRILVATDAAREGVNLQAHCADLFHLDIPWNPSRLEQRNGRIDRTLQPAAEVRCHYFVYPDRVEDQVLATVVEKLRVIQAELGSLGAVLLGQLESALEQGISAKTAQTVAKVGVGARTEAVSGELEAQRDDLEKVRAEVERAGRRLEASKKSLEVEPESLRGVVEVGLHMAGAAALAPHATTSDGRPTFSLPSLDRTWDVTLDSLRPPRGRTEPFWEWRQKPPKPVTFHPLSKLSEDAEQLHLAHPLVKRVLDRFLAQGFGAHDLSRVSAVVAEGESVVRVVAFARLTLFGTSAARLHDQIVPVAAAWPSTSDALDVKPYKDRATAVAAISQCERLLAARAAEPGGLRSPRPSSRGPTPTIPNETIQKRIREHAPALFMALWAPLEAEADALAAEARRGLAERAHRESDDLKKLLLRQREAIQIADARLRTQTLFEVEDKDQKRQVENDLKHLEKRRQDLEGELEREPKEIAALYDVQMQRITPIGLVVLWPEALT